MFLVVRYTQARSLPQLAQRIKFPQGQVRRCLMEMNTLITDNTGADSWRLTRKTAGCFFHMIYTPNATQHYSKY